MRQETINICKFGELSEEAKQAARNWWWDLESSDPAWYGEHRESARSAIEYWKRHTVEESIIAADKFAFTGYCDDAILADVLRNYPEANERNITEAYNDAWDAEMFSRMESDYIDEQIEVNEYEFLESGEFYG